MKPHDSNEDFSINAFWNKVVFDSKPEPVLDDSNDSKIRIPLRTLNLNSNIFNEFPPTSTKPSKVRILSFFIEEAYFNECLSRYFNK